MAKGKNIKQKNKAKHKKQTSFKNKMVKNISLYGKPNVEKRELLKKQQQLYTAAINTYIDYLYNMDNYNVDVFMSIVNNTTKSPLLRDIEKSLRKESKLKSALSQAAFDDAVNKVSNHFNNIKNEMYAFDKNDFVSSKVLFCMSLYNYEKDDMLSKLNELMDIKKQALLNETEDGKIKKLNKDIDFYQDLINFLLNLNENDFNFIMDEFYTWYELISSSYKKPSSKKEPVRMTSAACKLEKSKTTQYPCVISIISPDSNKRIEVPVKTSKKGLQRLRQYKNATTLTYTIREDGKLRIDIAIEKEVTPLQTISQYIGVDTGITDTFYTSEGLRIGGSYENEKFYKDEVEPSWAEINKLKQKKRKLKDYLQKHKEELTDIQIKQFRVKMDHIENNIRQNKKAQRLTNRYHNLNEQIINQSCKEYIKSLNGNKSIITVIEQLDMKEFNKSRRQNSMHSLFTRGQLQKRLMEQLNWNGFQFVEVEPAFTSQICPVCGNLNSKNRSEDDKKDFTCTCCGFHDDADHVGAVNIKNRAQDEEILKICEEFKYNKKDRHKQIKELYNKRNLEYIKQHSEIIKIEEVA